MATIELPVPGVTPGPDYAELINAALTSVNSEVNKLVNDAADTFDVRNTSDVSAAISSIVSRGSGIIRVPSGVTLSVSETIQLPNEVRAVIVDGTVSAAANVTVFRRDGLPVGSNISITAPISAGARTVSANPASLAVGDWVFVVSTDTLPGTTDKLGYMRQVRSLSETTVTFDTPIPRDMPDSSRRMRKIDLASPILFGGNGSITQSNPQAFSASLISLWFCRDVTISKPLRLRDGGGPAINYNHVVGFQSDPYIDNFIDDLANSHVGYGHNVGGGSRDGYIGGIVSRVRHAFTTNVGGSHPSFVFYGEPENILVEPVTRYCTDKALDTHRAGWGIKLRARDTGSGGGVQVRADNCYVEATVDGNFVGDVVTVWSYVTVPPRIGPVVAAYCTGSLIKADSAVVVTTFPQRTAGVGAAFTGVGPITVTPETRVAVKSSDQSVVNSIVPVAAAELSFSVEANATYLIEGTLVTYGNQSGDSRFSWSYPDSSSIRGTWNGLSTGATGSSGSIVRNVASTGTAEVQLGTAGSNVDTAVLPKALLTTGATPGTLSIMFAQGVAEATGLTLKAGSTLRIDRIR